MCPCSISPLNVIRLDGACLVGLGGIKTYVSRFIKFAHPIASPVFVVEHYGLYMFTDRYATNHYSLLEDTASRCNCRERKRYSKWSFSGRCHGHTFSINQNFHNRSARHLVCFWIETNRRSSFRHVFYYTIRPNGFCLPLSFVEDFSPLWSWNRIWKESPRCGDCGNRYRPQQNVVKTRSIIQAVETVGEVLEAKG